MPTPKLFPPFATTLLHGYCRLNFNNNIPNEIINLFTFYCFILDEFEYSIPNLTAIPNEQETILINNTIVTATDTYLLTRNSLKPIGQYHWSFKITNCAAWITFGFIQNDHYITGYKANPSDKWNDLIIFHVYFNCDTMTVVYDFEVNQYYHNGSTIELKLNTFNDFKLCLHLINSATIEMIDFSDVNWFIHQTDIDAITHIKYAESVPEIHEKIKHYSIALTQHPTVESWNNYYLNCLQKNDQHEKAYIHAMSYKKGHRAISKLIGYFCVHPKIKQNRKYIEYSHQLCRILTNKELKKYDLYFETAFCCYKFGDKPEAIKYYQLYHDQHQNNNTKQKRVTRCIGNMAKIYLHLNDIIKALELFLSLSKAEIDRRNFNSMIGRCYYQLKQYKKAIPFFETHLEQNPNECRIYRQISRTYSEIQEYEIANKYLERAFEIKDLSNDDKSYVYQVWGVNQYYQGDLYAGIECTLKAVELNPKYAVFYNNLGRYYYELGEYDESYRYLNHAITLNSAQRNIIGNYGIALFFQNRYDEAVFYLEKCLLHNDHSIRKQLVFDCFYFYGMILFDKGEFDKSIGKCLDAIHSDEFGEYKNKHKVYALLNKNYQQVMKCKSSSKCSLI
eukprot:266157_1